MSDISNSPHLQKTSFELVAENALLISWPEQISIEQHNVILFNHAILKQKLGNTIVESLVSYNSILLYFTFTQIKVDDFIEKVRKILSQTHQANESLTEKNIVNIPVLYDTEHKWDLASVAKQCQLSIDEVIATHSSQQYHSFALGFTPGFCYLANVPEQLHLPRKSSPRVKVPVGAVAIAEQQTAVYPSESPGGWQIIGQTPIAMSHQENDKFEPLISVGDKVMFYPISKTEFNAIKHTQNALIATKEQTVKSIEKNNAKHILEIVHCKGKITLQDLGRITAQHLGFSASGAADEYAFLYANKLISQTLEHDTNNNINPTEQLACATLEICLGQASFRVNQRCTIAITGADCQAKINQQAIKNWQCYMLNTGDVVELLLPKKGIYSYIAIKHGFNYQVDQAPLFHSFSTTENEQQLASQNNMLQQGSLLYCNQKPLTSLASSRPDLNISTTNLRYSTSSPTHFYPEQHLTLRFIPSKLFNSLATAQQQQLITTTYRISANSNRMGMRLQEHSKTDSLKSLILTDIQRNNGTLSKPVAYGMIQLPSDEQPIILMKERQTMGGYPVLGTVIQTDLFRLSQMRPGQTVNFITTTDINAQQQLHTFYEKFLASND